MDIIKHIAQRAEISISSVRATVQLLEQGGTVPFITRYRQGQTGLNDAEQVRAVQQAHTYVLSLISRKETILKTIAEQGKLTDVLKLEIECCEDATALEDLYLPYKPKRKTKATTAREQGLEPLARIIQSATSGDEEALVKPFVQGEIFTKKEAITGAQYILAEEIAEDAATRALLREEINRKGLLETKLRPTGHADEHKFEIYFEFAEPISRVKPHQTLAINRGEALGILSVGLALELDHIENNLSRRLGIHDRLLFHEAYTGALKLALTRYLLPALEREVRNQLKAQGDAHAITTFALNLKNLLLQPPLIGHTVLGLDPGFASGCKVAVVDANGGYQTGDVIYPTPPRADLQGAERKMLQLIERYGVTLIAIGNGTASRETEQFVADLIQKHSLGVHYLMVSEAGASVYSASPLAAREFPDLDATQRGNISIARRVQDPLAELVKIAPESLGVGLYQHDVDQTLLQQELTHVVEWCVNEVGVDLNTASAELLGYVSGLNSRLADSIVATRQKQGAFSSRDQLRAVKGIGDKVFEQSAGFLRIRKGTQPLDATAIHPEAYPAVQAIAAEMGTTLAELSALGLQLKALPETKKISLLHAVGIDEPTFTLILQNLIKPGRDPREELPATILKSNVVKFEDLNVGDVLKGTVRNVVDFGAFVDIGLKSDALLHISKMDPEGKFVKNPHAVVKVGQVVNVRVDRVEADRGRVSLALVSKE